MALVERNRDPSARDLRVFGLLLGVFFVVAGFLVLKRSGSEAAAAAVWAAAVLVPATYFALPPLRWPLYTAWTTAFYPIGWGVSYLLLIVIFFVILTPFGFAMRLLGYDPMRRKSDSPDASCWTKLEIGTDRARYFRQS